MLLNGVWIALLFIFVIFGLSAGLIVIYQRGKRADAATPRAGDVGYEREQKLFSMYQNLEDMVDGFDAYIEETRAAFEMERIDLLREKEDIARMHASVLAALQSIQEAQGAPKVGAHQAAMPLAPRANMPPIAPKAAEPQGGSPYGARTASIRNLYAKGHTLEAIAKELGVSRSEVQLAIKVSQG